MARLSINEMTTYRWSFDEDVRNYKAAGIPAIGVWRRKLSDYGEARGIELLMETGLAVSNLVWAGGFTGSEGHSFRESLDDAAESIRLAAAMNAKCVVVYSGARAGHTQNHARRLLVTALKELAPLAADHRVVLALEPMHPACTGGCTFLSTLDAALEIVDLVSSPQVMLSFDTYHMGVGSEGLTQLSRMVKKIAIVHLADGHPPDDDQHRTPLGHGCVPLQEIVATLRSGGYDGDFDVELFGDDIPPDTYESLLRETQAEFARITAA